MTCITESILQTKPTQNQQEDNIVTSMSTVVTFLSLTLQQGFALWLVARKNL